MKLVRDNIPGIINISGKTCEYHFADHDEYLASLYEKMREELDEFIEKKVNENEEKFLEFFNKAQPINTRLHQFELLPGFGKKHMKALLEARKEKAFESFDDIRARVHNLPDPKKVVEKRIMEELTEIKRHNLFIR